MVSSRIDRKGDGRPEYRLTITVAEHGRRDVAEDCIEKLFEAFNETHPEVGAVIGANYHLGRLDATFALNAPDAQTATKRGAEIFIEAATASGLEATEIIEINAVSVGEATVEEADRELAGAL
jgi:hypothetical protein